MALLALAATSMHVACGPRAAHTTVRLIDGRPQASRYVSPAAYAHFLRGELALRRGQTRRAVEHFRAALSFDPGAPYLHTRIAAAALATGKVDRARAHLVKALRRRPGFPDALLLLATISERAGDRRAAIGALRRCVADNPRQAQAYVRLAELLQVAGRAGEARRLLDAMGRLLPGDHRTHRARATLCLRQLDYACAARALARAARLRPDVATLVQLGQVHRALGAPDAALRALREAFDRTDGHHRVARLLALTLGQAGRKTAVDDLITLLERASHGEPKRLATIAEIGIAGRRPTTVLTTLAPHLRANPESLPLLLARARALDAAGRPEEALGLLGRPALVTSAEAGPQAAGLRARIARRQGQGATACARLREAITRHGQRETLVLAHSTCLAWAGDPTRAIAVIREALAKQRQSYALRFGLALALERAGQVDQAIAVAERLVRKRRDDAAALNFIGYAKAERGVDLDGAERTLRRALHLAPDRSYIIDSFGWLLFRRGRVADAARVLQYASRLAPREPEILGHLADVQAALKRTSAAARLYRRALELSRDPRLVRSLRARLAGLKRRPIGQRPTGR